MSRTTTSRPVRMQCWWCSVCSPELEWRKYCSESTHLSTYIQVRRPTSLEDSIGGCHLPFGGTRTGSLGHLFQNCGCCACHVQLMRNGMLVIQPLGAREMCNGWNLALHACGNPRTAWLAPRFTTHWTHKSISTRKLRIHQLAFALAAPRRIYSTVQQLFSQVVRPGSPAPRPQAS